MSRKWIVIIGLILALLGCTEPIKERRIENVVRVFMHEPTRYTILTQSPSSSQIKMETFTAARSEGVVQIYTDVAAGDPLWVLVARGERSGIVKLELHLHDVRDIEGGAWDHGKHSRGQTNVLQ